MKTQAYAEYFEAYKRAIDADNAFQSLLEAKYGKDAGNARYDHRRIATPELDAALKAKILADDTMRARLADARKELI